jgi:hypothetical protein
MWKINTSFIGLLFLSGLLPGNVQAQDIEDSCRPEPNPEAVQYIVGYGSLMEQESRSRTTSNISEVKPVIVSGFQRIWGINVRFRRVCRNLY